MTKAELDSAGDWFTVSCLMKRHGFTYEDALKEVIAHPQRDDMVRQTIREFERTHVAPMSERSLLQMMLRCGMSPAEEKRCDAAAVAEFNRQRAHTKRLKELSQGAPADLRPEDFLGLLTTPAVASKDSDDSDEMDDSDDSDDADDAASSSAAALPAQDGSVAASAWMPMGMTATVRTAVSSKVSAISTAVTAAVAAVFAEATMASAAPPASASVAPPASAMHDDDDDGMDDDDDDDDGKDDDDDDGKDDDDDDDGKGNDDDDGKDDDDDDGKDDDDDDGKDDDGKDDDDDGNDDDDPGDNANGASSCAAPLPPRARPPPSAVADVQRVAPRPPMRPRRAAIGAVMPLNPPPMAAAAAAAAAPAVPAPQAQRKPRVLKSYSMNPKAVANRKSRAKKAANAQR